MKVQVTEWHIKTGLRGSCRRCPIANALTARLPAGESVEVHEGWYGVYDAATGKRKAHGSLPAACQHFVVCFDDGRKVEPFEFEIEVKYSE